MMASAFKSVVVLLASLQLTQQAALPSEFYNKKLLNPTDNKLEAYNVPPIVEPTDSTKYEIIEGDELAGLSIDHDSATNSRAKRQDTHDPNLDAEIISNDPEMFSYGISMPLTMDSNDDNPGHQVSSSLDEDVNAETSETRGPIVANEFLDTNDAALTNKPTEEKHLDASSPHDAHNNQTESHDPRHSVLGDTVSQESELREKIELASEKGPIQSQDDININSHHDNSDDNGVMSDEGYVTLNPFDQDNIEENLLEEEGDKNELKKTFIVANEGISDTEGYVNLPRDEMKEHEAHLNHTNEHDNKLAVGSEVESTTDNTPIIVNSLENHYKKEEDVDAEVFSDESKAGSHESEEHGRLGELRAGKNDNVDLEEGSGNVEDITSAPNGTVILDDDEYASAIPNTFRGETSSTNDNMDFNIDSESTSDKAMQVEKGVKDVSPISDPTQEFAKVDHESEKAVPLEENTSEKLSAENVSNDDLSQTYDPKKIGDPLDIDKGEEIAKTTEKVFETMNNFDTADREDVEGSGEATVFSDNEPDKETSEGDAVVKLSLGINDAHDSEAGVPPNEEQDKEEDITIAPVSKKHSPALFAPRGVLEASKNTTGDIGSEELTTLSVVANENGITSNPVTELPSDLVLYTLTSFGDTENVEDGILKTTKKPEDEYELRSTSGVNKVGLINVTESASESNTTSSSSTGSFIVLGAIILTIVLLAGYAFIKSRRQKRRHVRRPLPKRPVGTELRERKTLLKEDKEHGPGNGNAETGRLLKGNEEGDKNDPKDGDSKMGNGENGTGKSAETPNADNADLTGVKVNEAAANPFTGDQRAVNGNLSKNSAPETSRPPDEPGAPLADDKAPFLHGMKPEITKAKMFIDNDSIPKTPIVIVKRGPPNVEM